MLAFHAAATVAAGDADEHARTAGEHCDRLLRDVARDQGAAFDVEAFVPALQARLAGGEARALALGWASLLVSVPDMDCAASPGFAARVLPALFGVVAAAAQADGAETAGHGELARYVLDSLLQQLRDRPDAASLGARALPVVTKAAEGGAARDWLAVLVGEICAAADTVLQVPEVLAVTLPALPAPAARATHEALLRVLAEAAGQNEELGERVAAAAARVLKNAPLSGATATRVAALEWLLAADGVVPIEVVQDAALAEALLGSLLDGDERVVVVALEVLARLCERSEPFFRAATASVLGRFATTEARAPLLVRRLCVLLGARRVFEELARQLAESEAADEAYAAARALSFLLLTAPETHAVRLALIGTGQEGEEKTRGRLFGTLYRAWAHSGVAAFGLCLLAHAYDHAVETMVHGHFARQEPDVAVLVELDKLVQLLESPVFVHLRLELLDASRNGPLLRALYGLLMLLPQSAAYGALRSRLGAVSMLADSQAQGKGGKKSVGSTPAADYAALGGHFVAVQGKHEALRQKVLYSQAIEGSERVRRAAQVG